LTFVADESVDKQIIDRLRDEGFQVFSIAEDRAGISDDEVLQLAAVQKAILITADKDFGDLVYQQMRASSGVILLRISGLSQDEKCAVVSHTINKHALELKDNFTVIGKSAIRIRKHPL
jgi:predicted nuclease of predicted toxin-antitoxin system